MRRTKDFKKALKKKPKAQTKKTKRRPVKGTKPKPKKKKRKASPTKEETDFIESFEDVPVEDSEITDDDLITDNDLIDEAERQS